MLRRQRKEATYKGVSCNGIWDKWMLKQTEHKLMTRPGEIRKIYMSIFPGKTASRVDRLKLSTDPYVRYLAARVSVPWHSIWRVIRLPQDLPYTLGAAEGAIRNFYGKLLKEPYHKLRVSEFLTDMATHSNPIIRTAFLRGFIGFVEDIKTHPGILRNALNNAGDRFQPMIMCLPLLYDTEIDAVERLRLGYTIIQIAKVYPNIGGPEMMEIEKRMQTEPRLRLRVAFAELVCIELDSTPHDYEMAATVLVGAEQQATSAEEKREIAEILDYLVSKKGMHREKIHAMRMDSQTQPNREEPAEQIRLIFS